MSDLTLIRDAGSVHFIGIGGEGMTALAQYLLQSGFSVGGSDIVESAALARLRRAGADIGIGHRADRVRDAQAVVFSAAVARDNPEMTAAAAAGIPLYGRGEFLAHVMRPYGRRVAVSGSHGKTTVAALLTAILRAAERDPNFAVGACLADGANNGHAGRDDCFIAEGDESDGSFLLLPANLAVVTNIDADHLGYYGGDASRLREAFVAFVNQMSEDGVAVCCLDDLEVRRVLPQLRRQVITYGMRDDADVVARRIQSRRLQTQFDLVRRDRSDLDVTLNLPGVYNVANALAAAAAAECLGVDDTAIQRGLAQFRGVARRFQDLGVCRVGNATVQVIHDYGHHPRELEAVITATRAISPDKTLAMIFEPHRYSRTHDLFDQFVTVLAQVDQLYLLPIYAAFENNPHDIDSRRLYEAVCRHKSYPRICHHAASATELQRQLTETLTDDCVLLIQGAGPVGDLARRLCDRYAISPSKSFF